MATNDKNVNPLSQGLYEGIAPEILGKVAVATNHGWVYVKPTTDVNAIRYVR
jgi:hypothetical protein